MTLCPHAQSTSTASTTPTRLTHRAAAILALLTCSLAAIPGCSVAESLRGRPVRVEGSHAAVATLPYLVQVENRLGSVRIVADPTLKEPRVYASVTGKSEPRLASWVAATIEARPDQRVLRVLSADPALDKIPVIIDVFVPTVAGTMVRNQGGTVRIRNVAGPIQVFNGITDGNGGDVDVRTDAALAGPVNIQARNGDVTLHMGRGSIGKLEVDGKQGVSVDTAGLALVGVRSNATSYRADMGVWGQQFKLQAQDGRVALRVVR